MLVRAVHNYSGFKDFVEHLGKCARLLPRPELDQKNHKADRFGK